MITQLITAGKSDIAEHLAHHNIHTLEDLATLANGRSQLCYTIGLSTEELDLLEKLLLEDGQILDTWLNGWTPKNEAETIAFHKECAKLAQGQPA